MEEINYHTRAIVSHMNKWVVCKLHYMRLFILGLFSYSNIKFAYCRIRMKKITTNKRIVNGEAFNSCMPQA
jgi:hypothetical protein